MPRLIRQRAPGRYRRAVEYGRGAPAIRKPGDDTVKTVADVLNVSAAVIKHPVTDLIVRGIDAAVRSGKEDVEGYQDLAKKRAENLRRRAAESKAPRQPPLAPAAVRRFAGAPIGEQDVGFQEMVKEEFQAPGAPAAAPPPPAPGWDLGAVQGMPQPPAMTERMVATAEEGFEPAPPRAKTYENVPRTMAELMAFVANPRTTPEELDWALKQAARFAPVTSLMEIGKPNIVIQQALLSAYEKGTKRTPTALDVAALGLKERKEGRAGAKYKTDLAHKAAELARKGREGKDAWKKLKYRMREAEKRAKIISGKKGKTTAKKNIARVNSAVALYNALTGEGMEAVLNTPAGDIGETEYKVITGIISRSGGSRGVLNAFTSLGQSKTGSEIDPALEEHYGQAQLQSGGRLPPPSQLISVSMERVDRFKALQKEVDAIRGRKRVAKEKGLAKKKKATTTSIARATEKLEFKKRIRDILLKANIDTSEVLDSKRGKYTWAGKGAAAKAEKLLGKTIFSNLKAAIKAYNAIRP